MTIVRDETHAFGGPGIAPRWTRGAKDAVGTAYSSSSRVWFTTSAGILNEVYYPTIDRPQIRDLQFLITDGASFCHDERRDLETHVEYIDHHALGVRIENRDPEGRYALEKEIISDPHQPCILMRTRFVVSATTSLRLFVLVAPHLDVGGMHNHAMITEIADRKLLTATGDQRRTWLACGATAPFLRCSSGYVGESDGWTDLQNFEMDWEFDAAPDGNVALIGEIDLSHGPEFTLGLAFGDGLHNAVSTLVQALGFPFSHRRRRFVAQWRRAVPRVDKLQAHFGADGGALFHMSHRLLLAHEDKTYPGAMIASMSIPWGETKSDEDLGGYHLVWPRDMVHSATGLLASGHTETPLRALMYLATAQQADGGFAQNFWINGDPYWMGIQLDEVAFPILLAHGLAENDALRAFDPYSMVMRAAGYLVREGPATQQERWEENSGYSPSTLASNIAALTCAAGFASARDDEVTSRFVQDYADFLDDHLESWTVTTDGSLLADVPRHYIRIHPVEPGDTAPDEDPNHGEIPIKNGAPGEPSRFPAKDVVDGGFLELVRYGVRDAHDPLIVDSLRVIDSVLKVDTPFGPCWRRYNHDGYGQRPDGTAFDGWGCGRAWPLLTGERGHYELAAGRAPQPYLRTMERFATETCLLPEQIWDERDVPSARMFRGRPTGAAMPLAWAHAEYIKLLRSAADGRVFDRISAVAERYSGARRRPVLKMWKFNRQTKTVPAGSTLRIMAGAPFRLRLLADGSDSSDLEATGTSIGMHYADIPLTRKRREPVRFTFYWPESDRWEGREFRVDVKPDARERT